MIRAQILIAAVFIATASAQAKPAPKIGYPDQYKVDFSEFTYRTPVSPAKDDSRKVEVLLSASSWAPMPFTTDNRLRSSAEFQSAMPTVTAALLAPAFLNTRFGTLAGQLTLGVNRMERSTKLSDGTTPSAQALYLIPLEAGVRARPLALRTGKLQGYAATSVGPTLGFSERSVFDDGETHIGYRGSAQIGFELAIFGDTKIDVFGMGTVGSLNSQSLNGLGAGAGLGVLL